MTGKPYDWRKRATERNPFFAKKAGFEVGSEEEQRFFALALGGEVGEFLNLVKKIWRGDYKDIPTIQSHLGIRSSLVNELADINIYLHLAACSLGVDLEAATILKCQEVDKRWDLDVDQQ